MNVSFEQLKKIRDFVRLKIGIFIDDYKLTTIYRRKIVDLIQRHGFKDFETFYSTVTGGRSPELLQELYNTMTVNETYFFREKEQFEILVRDIIPELDSKKSSFESINILSAPCSTGEEVYTIAIYLMEHGLVNPSRKFMILGIDVDSDAVKQAEEGFYTEKSMRGVPGYIKEKYFVKQGGGYQVIPQLRQAVSFKVVNVLDRYEMRRLGRFDVIFSRNMLIYFEERLRNETIATFYSILKPEGYLFLGHAERMPPTITLFKERSMGKAIVYQGYLFCPPVSPEEFERFLKPLKEGDTLL
ncbi:MAG: protein-glutamate O-methyltransferase CheR [Aquificae bacterium]|nr:protein-glutamate O-methyltransferase CheR [Aquificota bacterium]